MNGEFVRPLGRAIHSEPLPLVEMIDGVQPTRIGKQPEADCPDEVRQDEVDNLPLVPDVIVGCDEPLALFADGGRDGLNQFHNGIFLDPRDRLDRRLDQCERFDGGRGRSQRAETQHACHPRDNGVEIALQFIVVRVQLCVFRVAPRGMFRGPGEVFAIVRRCVRSNVEG